MMDMNTEQYIEMIKRSNEAHKNDTMILYALTHKKSGQSLKKITNNKEPINIDCMNK